MSDAPATPPTLRVVHGSPTAAEIAALTAIVAAAGASEHRPAAQERRGRWNDPAARHRRALLPGPNGWRTAYLT